MMNSKLRLLVTALICLSILAFNVTLCACIDARSDTLTHISAEMHPTTRSVPRDFAFNPPREDAGLTVADASSDSLDMRRPKMRRMQLALARICVSEAGFQVKTNDCTMIYHALRSRSKTGELSLGIMKSYSKRSFDLNRQDHRRWIAHLNHEFSEPMWWRETVAVPWSRRRQGFINVYEHAGNLIRSKPANTCGIKIDHWGAPGFRREMHLGNGWRLIECGETLNDFWSLPQRRPRRH